ncbi:PadR family transcriptional regulator [[Clostridium] dakarense]|uniref:PadR family transcriptional regulator n=1 Tax=Faecalimicrobium dakarense TaxID=1301100 RepID=UPI0004BC72F7|nr:PadR family transcriptional regulator [[Clostridium] dakarense]
MSITSDLIRGHTETIILASLIKGDTYGYEINKSIKEKTNNEYELKEATLYSAFRRLEEGGMITSYWGNENKGARRRYYSITPLGKSAYEKNKMDWDEAKKLIDSLI